MRDRVQRKEREVTRDRSLGTRRLARHSVLANALRILSVTCHRLSSWILNPKW
jgi:hypothetical protein